jgi:hypothetical protein
MRADEYIVSYDDLFYQHIGEILLFLYPGFEAQAMKVRIVNDGIATDPDTVPDPDRLIAMYGSGTDPNIVTDDDLAAVIGNKKTWLLTADPVVPRSVVHLKIPADPKRAPIIEIDYRNSKGAKGGELDIEDFEFIQSHQVRVVAANPPGNFSRHPVRIFDHYAHETFLLISVPISCSNSLWDLQ